MKKGLCFTGLLVHFLLAVLALTWVTMYASWDIAHKQCILILDGALLLSTVIIGTQILKLGIDELLTPLELEGLTGMNRVIYAGSLLAVGLIIAFEIVMVLLYFFEGVKMEFSEYLRFCILPSITIAHVAFGACSYFGLRYFIIL